MQDERNNKSKIDKILDFVFPGYQRFDFQSPPTMEEISNILTNDKKIFIKIIPYICVGFLLLFIVQAIMYLFIDPTSCVITGMRSFVNFFCGEDGVSFFNAILKFILYLLGFIVVIEILLLFFWGAGKFKTTKYNITIPKPIAFSFWLLVIMLFSAFFLFITYDLLVK